MTKLKVTFLVLIVCGVALATNNLDENQKNRRIYNPPRDSRITALYPKRSKNNLRGTTTAVENPTLLTTSTASARRSASKPRQRRSNSLRDKSQHKSRKPDSYKEIRISVKSAACIALTIWNNLGLKVITSNVFKEFGSIIDPVNEITDYAAVSFFLDSFYLYSDDKDSIPFDEYSEILYRSIEISKCTDEMLGVINKYKANSTLKTNAAGLNEIQTIEQMNVLSRKIQAHIDEIMFLIMRHDDTFKEMLLGSYDDDSKALGKIIKSQSESVAKITGNNKLLLSSRISSLIVHLHGIGVQFETAKLNLERGEMRTGELYKAFVFDSAFDFGTVATGFIFISNCLTGENVIDDFQLKLPAASEMERWLNIISGHMPDFLELSYTFDMMIQSNGVYEKTERIKWRNQLNKYKVIHVVFREALTNILAEFPEPKGNAELVQLYRDMQREFKNVKNKNNRSSMYSLQSYNPSYNTVPTLVLISE